MNNEIFSIHLLHRTRRIDREGFQALQCWGLGSVDCRWAWFATPPKACAVSAGGPGLHLLIEGCS